MRQSRIALFLVLGILPAAVGVAPRSASAGGLNLYEVGSPDTGLAGAGYAARAQDASTLFTNPAGMTRLAESQFLFGLQPMHGDAHFDADHDTTTTGGDGGNALGFAYELAYFGDLSLDQERGPLAGRLSGEYERMLIHVFTFSIIWRP